MINRKINVGIDINEIFRAKWLQFDKLYAREFGENNIPDEPYTYDFFNHYKWDGIVEEIKELKEPEDMPDNINPIDYQIDKKTGEAPADFALFKKSETKELTPKESYNRFMYEDYLFEIFGSAPIMYRNMDLDVSRFYVKYKDTVNFTILSVENELSTPPTLFFLSKMMSRFKNYRFVENSWDMWKGVDVLITTDPKILKRKTPKNKSLIKLNRPYNNDIVNGVLDVLQIADLINNDEFEKIIKYKKKVE